MKSSLVIIAFAAFVVFPPAAAGELKPLDLSPAGASGSGARIASDGAGNIVAVWREVDGTSSIRAAGRPAGGTWGASQRISVPVAETESPEVAMDSLGNGRRRLAPVERPRQRRAGRDPVGRRRLERAAGLLFTRRGRIRRGRCDQGRAGDRGLDCPARPASLLPVVVTRDRRLLGAGQDRVCPDRKRVRAGGRDGQSGRRRRVVALVQDGAFLVVQSAVRSMAGSWSSPEVLSRPGRSASAPQLAMDASGNAVVAWLRSNGSWIAGHVTYRRAGGTWETPQDLFAARRQRRWDRRRDELAR